MTSQMSSIKNCIFRVTSIDNPSEHNRNYYSAGFVVENNGSVNPPAPLVRDINDKTNKETNFCIISNCALIIDTMHIHWMQTYWG